MRKGREKEREGGGGGNVREKVESLNGILEQMGSHRCRCLVYSGRVAFVSRWAPIVSLTDGIASQSLTVLFGSLHVR